MAAWATSTTSSSWRRCATRGRPRPGAPWAPPRVTARKAIIVSPWTRATSPTSSASRSARSSPAWGPAAGHQRARHQHRAGRHQQPPASRSRSARWRPRRRAPAPSSSPARWRRTTAFQMAPSARAKWPITETGTGGATPRAPRPGRSTPPRRARPRPADEVGPAGPPQRAPTTVATASRPTAALSIRLANSTMAWPSLADRGVKLSGSQRGQVEQPRPDPVSRTPAPTTVMTTRATSVTRTRVRSADGDRRGSRTRQGRRRAGRPPGAERSWSLGARRWHPAGAVRRSTEANVRWPLSEGQT